MPLFMIISGYLLSRSLPKYNPIKYCLNKFSQLGIPTIFWGGIFGLIIALISGPFSVQLIVNYIGGF